MSLADALLELYVDTTCSARPSCGPQDDVLQVCHL